MARRTGISIRQRRVSAELRALRLAKGLSCKDVAEGVDCSESKISRMETGHRGLQPDDVSAILGFLRASSALRKELLDLVRDGSRQNWHEIHTSIATESTNWKDFIRLETDADTIRNYEAMLLPGLTQTRDYALEVMRAGDSRRSAEEMERMVAARMARQRRLVEPTAPELHYLIEETALTWRVGTPATMRAQLRHLLHLAERPKITVQVVPFAAGVHPGMNGSFVIFGFPAEPPVAYLESRGTSTFIEEADHVKTFQFAWQKLRAIALSPDDSARLITSVIGEPPCRER
ncbi:helix-turn-helix domain-containing protein [Amycolatopsis sp. CA-230715]|uniref:helix-turn-helix domain-containing protein n=1 Tax=Amycolatopsis sp. CA-230715 TaxID=2745196 RepID=UPI001C0123C2|nr:helix-turn-helix transcriptional regulator [Amycolatopsis sp. CA-230715]